jgi:hypothetical protein
MEIVIEKDGYVLGRYLDLLVREEEGKPWYTVLSNGEVPPNYDFYLPPKGEFIVNDMVDEHGCELERFKNILDLDGIAMVGGGTARIDTPRILTLKLDRNFATINYLLYINIKAPNTRSSCSNRISAIAGYYGAIEDVGGALDVFNGFEL